MASLNKTSSGKNFIVFNDGECIKIENVRFSHPHFDAPFKSKQWKEGDSLKYSGKFMLPKETHAEAKAAIDKIIAAILKEKKVPKLPGKDKFCRDGDDEKDPVYENHWIVSASEERQPTVRNRKADIISDKKEIRDLIEGGYWGSVLIRPWFQNNDYGTKVNAGLVAVQHLRDDETFGNGRIDDTDAWANEGGDDSNDGDAMDDDDDDGM